MDMIAQHLILWISADTCAALIRITPYFNVAVCWHFTSSQPPVVWLGGESMVRHRVMILMFCKVWWADDLGERIPAPFPTHPVWWIPMQKPRGPLFGFFFEIVRFFSFVAHGIPIGLLVEPCWIPIGSLVAPFWHPGKHVSVCFWCLMSLDFVPVNIKTPILFDIFLGSECRRYVDVKIGPRACKTTFSCGTLF